MMRSLLKTAAAAAFAVGCLSGTAIGQESAYPGGTVSFVLGFSPGGGTDTVARIVADGLARSWASSVVVENKVGAGGLIAAQFVADAAPDGRTVLFDSSSFAIRPALDDALPYNAKEDLTPVSLVASAPYVLVVNPALEAETLADLIALAKERPGELTYASSGVGSALHLAGELLAVEAGIELVHVPYQGTAGIPDILAGRVDFGFVGLPQSLPLIQAGQLRAIGVTTTSRSAALPDVPTLQEGGLAQYESDGWYGVFVPAGTPESIVDQLSDDIAEVLKDPAVVELIDKQGLEPVAMPAAEFGAFLDAELTRWATVVQTAGVTVE